MKQIIFIRSIIVSAVGGIFTGLGISYFKIQDAYEVPRILMPVYHYCGHIGLAIGLIIIGLILVFLGYKKAKDMEAKAIVNIIAAIILFVVMMVICFKTNKVHSGQAEIVHEQRDSVR